VPSSTAPDRIQNDFRTLGRSVFRIGSAIDAGVYVVPPDSNHGSYFAGKVYLAIPDKLPVSSEGSGPTLRLSLRQDGTIKSRYGSGNTP